MQDRTVDIRGMLRTNDITFRHGFNPYSLPYPGYRGVPYTVRSIDLLSSGLRTIAGRIPHPQGQRSFTTLTQRIGTIRGEWIKNTLVSTDVLSIDIQVGLPIHSSEMNQHTTLAQ